MMTDATDDDSLPLSDPDEVERRIARANAELDALGYRDSSLIVHVIPRTDFPEYADYTIEIVGPRSCPPEIAWSVSEVARLHPPMCRRHFVAWVNDARRAHHETGDITAPSAPAMCAAMHRMTEDCGVT